MKIKEIKFNTKLLLLLLLAFVLWMWNVAQVDLTGDEALYSFRALGYFDYLASAEQTTPIQWLGDIPWWANLSFHDGPPLVFALQRVFFLIFGDNPWGAKLPFVLAGVLTLGLVYLISRELYARRAGYIALGLGAVLAFSTWVADIGYLESIAILWIALSLWLWIRYIKLGEKKYVYWWGLVLGLALLTKYTALFLVPVFISYILIYRRDILKLKEFYLALVVTLAVLLPVIGYNIGVYQTRGHFDAAVSAALGMESDDFLALASREVGFNIGQSMKGIFSNLSRALSPLVAVLFYLSIIWSLWRWRRKGGELNNVILLAFGWGLLLLAFIRGSEYRFLPILMPMMLLMIAGMVSWLWRFLEKRKAYLKNILVIFLVLVLTWEVAYNLNSNFLAKPLTTSWLVYTANNIGTHKLGFNRMESYMKNEVYPERLELERPAALSRIDVRVVDFTNEMRVIYFYDDSISWFANNWYLSKYSNYYGLPMLPYYAQGQGLEIDDPIGYFAERGVAEYYFIYGNHASVLDPRKIDGPAKEMVNKLVGILDSQGVEVVEIGNAAGDVAFKIYHFELK